MTEKYVVKTPRGNNECPGKPYKHEYLCAINYNPFGDPNGRIITTNYRTDAFVFTSISAAEFAAVMVGGFVVKLPVRKDK